MGPGQRQFRFEEIALCDEHVEIVGEPPFVAETRQLQSRVEGLYLFGLGRTLFASRRDGHQGVFNLPKGDKDRLFVLCKLLPCLSFGCPLLKS
jgi:hypothetical protein